MELLLVEDDERVRRFVRRGLEALPGAVIVATVVPLTVQSGLPAALAIGTVIGLKWWDEGAYETDIGEQRVVMLEDGTRLLLNTDVPHEGQEPSSLLARAITEIVTPDNVYDRPASPR